MSGRIDRASECRIGVDCGPQSDTRAGVVAYEVLRVAAAGRVVATFTKRERRAYEAAVDALRGEECTAGDKRLLALDGSDHALCGSWAR